MDAITRSKMQSWLSEVVDQVRASVLFVTHDIEAIYLSDRIYVLTERPAKREEVAIPCLNEQEK